MIGVLTVANARIQCSMEKQHTLFGQNILKGVKMKYSRCFIFLCLIGVAVAVDTCYKYSYYYRQYYTSYCSGYCAGGFGSEYCLYYYYQSDGGGGGGGSSGITIGASVGGSIGGIVFFCVCCFCFAKAKG